MMSYRELYQLMIWLLKRYCRIWKRLSIWRLIYNLNICSFVVCWIVLFPLIAAEGYYFFLDKKVAKNQVSSKASLPHLALCCKMDRTALEYFTLCFAARCSHFCKISYALQPHIATIVLSIFGWSCRTDGDVGILNCHCWGTKQSLHRQGDY